MNVVPGKARGRISIGKRIGHANSSLHPMKMSLAVYRVPASHGCEDGRKASSNRTIFMKCVSDWRTPFSKIREKHTFRLFLGERVAVS